MKNNESVADWGMNGEIVAILYTKSKFEIDFF